jgi:outer membrane immunogenic protein
MRKVVAATVALVAFAAITAAEAAAQTPPIWNWAGFYVGGNFGYSWGRSNSTLTLSDATTGTALDSAAVAFAINGIIGGGQIGYNWQRGNWVFGLETDIEGSGQRSGQGGSLVCPGGSGGPPPGGIQGTCSAGHLPDGTSIAAAAVTDSLSEKIDWFGTLRGRLGPTITPTLWAYLTGGLAYGRVSAADTVSGTNFDLFGDAIPVTATLNPDSTKIGWTFGGGFEALLGGRWTGKIEYLYIDFGDVSGSFLTPIVTPPGTPPGHLLAASFNSHITDNILRVGVNYKLGGP